MLGGLFAANEKEQEEAKRLEERNREEARKAREEDKKLKEAVRNKLQGITTERDRLLHLAAKKIEKNNGKPINYSLVLRVLQAKGLRAADSNGPRFPTSLLPSFADILMSQPTHLCLELAESNS